VYQESAPPVVEARGFAKTFGGRKVLNDVDLTIRPCEIRGLVGQNGSGKSTFIKILSGYHGPDPGAELRVRGEPVGLPLAPDEPARLGLSFVHQDLGLFEAGSVLENLMVGRYQTRRGWRIPWRQETARAHHLLERFGLDLDPDTPLAALSEVERAIVAIARAMSGPEEGGGLLVLDEPTARLPRHTVDSFFNAVRSLAARGMGVLFVSHRLDEVLAITHRVTVLRDGVAVADHATAGLTQKDLATDILGFSLEQLYPEPHHSTQDVVLAVEGLGGGIVEDFSAVLHRGEILGLTGLVGMGHDQVLHLLFGSIPARSGTLRLAGRTLDAPGLTPRKAMGCGLALLPANRLREGGVAEASAAENITLAILDSFTVGGLLRHRREEQAVRRLMTDFDVQPVAPDLPLGTFSGGNQQKGLVAKWFARVPAVMLLDEPTHGVDVGAKRQIFRQLRDAAEGGMGVIMASVEAEDLAQICDRVIVLRHGRAVALLRGSELSAARIAEQALLGVQDGDPASSSTTNTGGTAA
jgi:ribose transport system ATP-binding protein